MEKEEKNCRRKQHQKKKAQMKRSTDTVVEISNVPLSEDSALNHQISTVSSWR